MKDPKDMTDRQLISWMDKTANTIGNIPRVGRYWATARAESLRWRFNDLQEEMQERGIWGAWCDKTNTAKSANFCDYMA